MVVATGVFLATMDSSMINVALPSIMRHFGCTFFQCQWVVQVYLLTITITLPLWGHISDRFGMARLYVLGMLLFVFGSGGSGLSLTLGSVIFFRFTQAVGAAMMMACGPAIIAHISPVGHLGKALGFIGVATSAGLMSGPVVSGFLLHHFSWRYIFFATIPFGVFTFIAGWFFILPKIKTGKKSPAIPFGWPSFVCWSLFVAGVIIFTASVKNMANTTIGWQIPFLFFLFFLLIYSERKAEVPLVPRELIGHKYFTIGMLTSILSFSVLFIVIILIPFYLTFLLNLSTIEIGTVMMALPVTLSVVSPIAGRLYDYLGARKLTTIGLLICTISVISFIFTQADTSTGQVMWGLALLGMGQSIFLSPNSASVLSGVEEKYTGITSSLLATSRNIGMLFGVSLAGIVFSSSFYYFSQGASLNGFEPHHVSAFLRSLHISFIVAAALSLTGTLLSFFR